MNKKVEILVSSKSYLSKCPCKGCTTETGRHIGCHGKCDGYKTWKTEVDTYNQIDRDRRLINQDAYNFKKDGIEKARRRGYDS